MFKGHESAGHALNAFFDSVRTFNVKLPVEVPTLALPPRGTAERIKKELCLQLPDFALSMVQVEEKTARRLQRRKEKRQQAILSSGGFISSNSDATASDDDISSDGSGTIEQWRAALSIAMNNCGIASAYRHSRHHATRRPSAGEISRKSSSNSNKSPITEPIHSHTETFGRPTPMPLSSQDTGGSYYGSLRAAILTETDPLAPTIHAHGLEADEISLSDQNATSLTHPNANLSSRFHIFRDEVLGRGSFGVVFRAWDEEEGRHVACKQISSRANGPSDFRTTSLGNL